MLYRSPAGTPSHLQRSLAGCLRFIFPSRQRDGGKASLRARPRHAEDQPTSDRGETTPPPAPARARSVNTYARPSPHGNIRASRPAASHAAPTACSRPGPPTTRSGGLSGRRTPSGRRATTRSTPQPTAQPCQPKLRLKTAQTERTAEYSTQHTPAARAQHTQTRTRIQHAHAHSTRASHASAALHTEHTGPQQQQQSATIHTSHTRAHTPHCRRTHWASPRGTNWSEADSSRHQRDA